jgi:hypothetical protein
MSWAVHKLDRTRGSYVELTRFPTQQQAQAAVMQLKREDPRGAYYASDMFDRIGARFEATRAPAAEFRPPRSVGAGSGYGGGYGRRSGGYR